MPEDLFDGGPLFRLQRCLGLTRPGDRCIRRRALATVLMGWAPLALLSALRQALTGDGSFWYFVQDHGANTRFLVAVPLFIVAEAWCLPRLSRVSRHFLVSGIVTGDDRERLNAKFTSTNRLLNSNWIEILVLVAAYASVAYLSVTVTGAELPRWHVYQSKSGLDYTAAGQWHLLVSLPLLMFLLYSWIWRQCLWCRLLWSISKLRLQLIPAHPDHLGGLGFLGATLRGYWPLSFALAAIVAGRLGNHTRAGLSLYDSRYLVAGLLAVVLVLVLTPFFPFIPILRKLRERTNFKYGALGLTIGRAFERKWFSEDIDSNESVLTVQDFSATTDLYSIIGNAHQINRFPIALGPIRELVIVTMLPFVPVVLLVVPFDAVLNTVTKLLL